MITEPEYLKAKKIVDDYKNQQKVRIEKLKNGDLDLLTILSARPKNALIKYNRKFVKNGEYLIYISDVIKFINESGTIYQLLKIPNVGKKSYEEIMMYIRPFL